MLTVETIGRIRRVIKGKTIKEIAEGFAEYDPQGAAVGCNIVRVRAGRSAAAEAGPMDDRPRGECRCSPTISD
jgi:hypothetical protein